VEAKGKNADHISSEDLDLTKHQKAGVEQRKGVPSQGVLGKLFRSGYLFDFFQAVWLMERLLPEARAPGESSQLGEERIRFRPYNGLVFPATDVKQVELLKENPQIARITVTFMGLYGVDSPLPVYFSDRIASETEESSPLRDFLDIFNHRLYSLFYRCWKKYRPALHFKAPGTDSESQRSLCLAGIGTRGSHSTAKVPFMQLAAFAGILSSRARHAEGLRNLVAHFFDGIDVKIIQNVPRWVSVPQRMVLSKGRGTPAILGRTTTIGEKVFDVSGKIRFVLKPLTLKQFLSLLPGGEHAKILHYLVNLYVPDNLEFDVALNIITEEIPPIKLGCKDTALGLATWIGRSEEKSVSRVVSYN
jgi:type VI secretion system protein ImpH